jgi:hypothetical protein
VIARNSDTHYSVLHQSPQALDRFLHYSLVGLVIVKQVTRDYGKMNTLLQCYVNSLLKNFITVVENLLGYVRLTRTIPQMEIGKMQNA